MFSFQKLHSRTILVIVGFIFLFWCYALYTGDSGSFLDCPPGSQQIQGFNSGSYTNLCVTPR